MALLEAFHDHALALPGEAQAVGLRQEPLELGPVARTQSENQPVVFAALELMGPQIKPAFAAEQPEGP